MCYDYSWIYSFPSLTTQLTNVITIPTNTYNVNGGIELGNGVIILYYESGTSGATNFLKGNVTDIQTLGSNKVITTDVLVPIGTRYMINVVFEKSETHSFAEKTNSWNGEYEYSPEFLAKSVTSIVSHKDAKTYSHSDDSNRNNFYGVQKNMEVEIPFNASPSEIKTYRNIQQEANEVFSCEFETLEGQESELLTTDFENIENQFCAALLKDSTTPNVTYPLIDGDDMRSSVLIATLLNNSNEQVRLFSVSVGMTQSNLHGYGG